jgi:biofilm PGA synthesis N-glycosyltransferase PgaC
VGAAGELFSLRRTLYEPIPDNVILDDFVISLKVAAKGYRIRYEPEAYAMELPSFSLRDEQKRKIRIAAGGFQAIGMLRSLFRIWKHPRLSFLYLSHRVLRWTLSPLCLILAFVSNAMLCLAQGHLLFKALFLAQLIFYGLSLLAAIPALKNRFRVLKLPYYFVFMNVSVMQGFFRFLAGSQSATWEKARRSQAAPLIK